MNNNKKNSIPLVLSPAARKALQAQQNARLIAQARRQPLPPPPSQEDWGAGDMVADKPQPEAPAWSKAPVIGEGPTDIVSKARSRRALEKISPPKAPPGKVHVQIDGVGKVELDDSFLKLSPADRQSTIDEIAAQTQRMVRPKVDPRQAPAWQSAPIIGETEAWRNDPIVGETEAWRDDPIVGEPQKPVTPLEKLKAAGSRMFRKADDAVRGVADTMTFGFADEIAAGLSSLTGIGGEKGNYDANVAKERERDRTSSGYRTAGQLAGALVVPAPAAAVKTTGRLLASSAAGGAAYGLGSGEGDLSDRLDEAAIGAGMGLAGGYVASKIPGAVKAVGEKLDNAIPSRFAAKEIADNPHAAVDAAMAQRIGKLVQNVPTRVGGVKLSKAAQARTLNKRIGQLEQSLLPTASQLKQLDISPVEREQLQAAIRNRHILDADDIEILRLSPAGNIVADAIIQAQSLRRLVPEGATPSSRFASGIAGEIVDSGGAAAGAALAGPAGAVGGRLVSAGLKTLGRSLIPDSGGEAMGVYNAVSKASPGYAKVLEQLGPDAIPEGPVNRLARIAGETLESRQSQAAHAAEEALAAKASNRAISVRNDLDNIRPQGGFRGLLYERTGLRPAAQDQGLLQLVNEGVITPAQFQQALESPEKLMRGNGGNAIADRLASLADEGVLPRDASWSPSPMVDLTRESLTPAHIRNPEAYRATAQGNQARVTETLMAVQALDGIDPLVRETLAGAISRIGNTSSRKEAEAILRSALADMPNDESSALASSYLSPLVHAIKQ